MRLRHSTRVALPLLLVALLAVAAGCGRDSSSSSSSGAAGTGDSNLSGTIQADGSSTVGPMTTYAAEQFQAANPNVNVTVGISGTGGGFERFCNGETDLSDASRPIKTDPADKEATVCKSKGIDYTEFLVANDGISLVVNKENDWAKCLTVDQLAGALGGNPEEAPFVLDVRQASEYEAGHVHGARHLTAGTLPDELETLPRNRPIAVMCASGYRSSVAASLLDKAGFEHVSWVADGVPAWRAAGYELEYGAEGAPAASAASTTRLGVEEPAGPHRH